MNLNPISMGPPVNTDPTRTGAATDPSAGSVATPYQVLILTLESGGDVAFYYQHTQAVPAGDWLVVHNLGKIPNVTVFDQDGNETLADVQVVDNNTLHVLFSYMATGKAVCS